MVVEIQALSHPVAPALHDVKSAVFRIEVCGRIPWWDRLFIKEKAYVPPYSREEFIAKLESEIDESLGTQNAAEVVRLTVPEF